MDGGGDNQLSVHFNRRPVNRRVQIILQDYQRWEQPGAGAFGHPRPARLTHRDGVIPLRNHDYPFALHFDTEADDSGFESGSESDML